MVKFLELYKQVKKSQKPKLVINEEWSNITFMFNKAVKMLLQLTEMNIDFSYIFTSYLCN